MNITTEQDALTAAKAIAAIMHNGKPQTVAGIRFKFCKGAFVIIAGGELGLGERFTVEQLGAHIWTHRDSANRGFAR